MTIKTLCIVNFQFAYILELLNKLLIAYVLYLLQKKEKCSVLARVAIFLVVPETNTGFILDTLHLIQS